MKIEKQGSGYFISVSDGNGGYGMPVTQEEYDQLKVIVNPRNAIFLRMKLLLMEFENELTKKKVSKSELKRIHTALNGLVEYGKK
jgi:hypothetical protein